MKKLSSFIVGLGTFLGMTATAFAQNGATCRVNGEVVPCDQAWSMFGSFMSAFGWLFGILALVGIVGSIFWLWMLIDCLKRNFKKDTDKVLWAAVIFFLHFVGAILYFFIVKNEDKK